MLGLLQKAMPKASLGSIEESEEGQSPSQSTKTPGSISGGAAEVRSKDKVARALHYGPDGELQSQAVEDAMVWMVTFPTLIPTSVVFNVDFCGRQWFLNICQRLAHVVAHLHY
jgi:hypothetical protein